jgi:hypothetical protein
MPKENALRFMMLAKTHEDVKRQYKDILNKYVGKDLTKEEHERIILQEVIPLAKSMGFDFSLEDFQKLAATC